MDYGKANSVKPSPRETEIPALLNPCVPLDLNAT
jgi:hypothetical protein